jgi:hypothetical protein
MNFNRHSLCEDLLFAIVLLLPRVCAAARYVESIASSPAFLRLDPKRCLSRPALGRRNGGPSEAAEGIAGTEPQRLARPAWLRGRSKVSGNREGAGAPAALDFELCRRSSFPFPQPACQPAERGR